MHLKAANDNIPQAERRIRMLRRVWAGFTMLVASVCRMAAQVPGLSTRAAEVVIAEIGLDMSRFPTAGHLLSWAGLVPALDESAGKRRSTRVTKGAPWLKPVLVPCAWAAANKKNSSFEAQFLRLKGRRGPKKAAVAVAASILTTVYHMLRDGTCYQDLGPNSFARGNPTRTARKLADPSAASVTSSKSGAPHDPSRSSF